MWVIVLLLLIGGTIVSVRLFRNGALGEVEPEEPEPAIPLSARAPDPAKTSAAPIPPPVVEPEAAPSAPAGAISEPSPALGGTPETPPPATWPGGPCPACGAQTVPAAKFCGECGHKLTANN